jgi:phosphohistidine phosphatase
MDLILWRHAEAEDSTPDMDRQLTLKGKKQAEKIAAFLHRHLPENTRILVSPAARTRQTAAAYSEHYTLVHNIAPGASPHAVLQAARWPNGLSRPVQNPSDLNTKALSHEMQHNRDDTVLLVGHQPTLGAVAAELLGANEAYLSVKKGSIWWFSCRVRDGYTQTVLKLVLTPDFL